MSNSDPTVAAGWQRYRSACYGVEPLAEEQAEETQQAFYAGVTWMLAELRAIGDRPDDDEEGGVKRLEALTQEAETWSRGRIAQMERRRSP